MGVLDTIKSGFESAWDTVTSALDPNSKVKADLNRILTVLVDAKGQIDAMKAQRKPVPAAMEAAYTKLRNDAINLIVSICTRDREWTVRLPTDLGLGGYACVRAMTRTEWNQTVKRQAAPATINGLGQLGAFVIPIVIAAIVVSISATGIAYLTTSEGRQRMDVAMKSADNMAAIMEAVKNGTLTASEAEKLLKETGKVPDSSGGGIFDSVGKTIAIAGAGLLGFAYLSGRLERLGKGGGVAGVDGSIWDEPFEPIKFDEKEYERQATADRKARREKSRGSKDWRWAGSPTFPVGTVVERVGVKGIKATGRVVGYRDGSDNSGKKQPAYVVEWDNEGSDGILYPYLKSELRKR